MANDVVKQGYVKLPSKGLGVWSEKKWLMLRRQSCKGPLRLEKYKDESTASVKSVYGANKKIIDLTRVDGAERLPESARKHAITVLVGTSNLLQFSVNSEMEAESWLSAIRGEMHPENRETQESFPVYMVQNDYFPSPGDCTLQLERNSVRILERYGSRELIMWPYSGMRRFGVEGDMFTIEAGSSSPLGEGKFFFRCNDSEFIYQRVLTLSQAMNRTSGNQSTPAFSESSWGNVASIRELSDRRTERSSAGQHPDTENPYHLDQAMPDRSMARRSGPLPPTPGGATTTTATTTTRNTRNEDPYGDPPGYNQRSNSANMHNDSLFTTSSSLRGDRSSNASRPGSTPRGQEGPGSPYYSVTRSAGAMHEGTNGTHFPSNSSASGSLRGASVPAAQAVGSPYYSVTRSGTMNNSRQPSAASGVYGEPSGRSGRTGISTEDSDDEVTGSMRSVRIDGPYYAVSGAGSRR